MNSLIFRRISFVIAISAYFTMITIAKPYKWVIISILYVLLSIVVFFNEEIIAFIKKRNR